MRGAVRSLPFGSRAVNNARQSVHDPQGWYSLVESLSARHSPAGKEGRGPFPAGECLGCNYIYIRGSCMQRTARTSFLTFLQFDYHAASGGYSHLRSMY